MADHSKYAKRGVSSSKDEVHKAIKHLDKGLFPTAFCKVLPDLVGGDDAFCNIMHADTAGTKTSLAYLYWKETGDMSVWEGVIQDAIVMNVDDMACVGCVDNIILSSTIGRNKNLIPGEVVVALIQGTSKFIEEMNDLGIGITLAGGETADVGDIVRTLDVGFTTFARMKQTEVIANEIEDGQVIVGFSSYGKASYESSYNGGMGSNGLTSARHDVLQHAYAEKYPESFDPHVDKQYIYCGKKNLTDSIDVEGFGEITIGKLILSPTRTYLPLLAKIINEKVPIAGLIHCSGGAQTKVMKFVNNRRIIKDNLLPIPPLFKLIESESGTDRKEMYQVFNMGHRLEAYLHEKDASTVIDMAKSFQIDAQIIGRVESAKANALIVKDAHGEYEYV